MASAYDGEVTRGTHVLTETVKRIDETIPQRRDREEFLLRLAASRCGGHVQYLAPRYQEGKRDAWMWSDGPREVRFLDHVFLRNDGVTEQTCDIESCIALRKFIDFVAKAKAIEGALSVFKSE